MSYTSLTVMAMIVAVVVDLFVLRTRVVAGLRFWLSMAIMAFFQVFIDGWLTRARDTIVIYNPDDFRGVRVFFNTPVEDFGFGFALIVLTLSIWVRLTDRTPAESPAP